MCAGLLCWRQNYAHQSIARFVILLASLIILLTSLRLASRILVPALDFRASCPKLLLKFCLPKLQFQQCSGEQNFGASIAILHTYPQLLWKFSSYLGDLLEKPHEGDVPESFVILFERRQLLIFVNILELERLELQLQPVVDIPHIRRGDSVESHNLWELPGLVGGWDRERRRARRGHLTSWERSFSMKKR